MTTKAKANAVAAFQQLHQEGRPDFDPSVSTRSSASTFFQQRSTMVVHPHVMCLSHNVKAPKWSFTSRETANVKHHVPGPGTYELSPSENAAKHFGCKSSSALLAQSVWLKIQMSRGGYGN
eukprot:g10793.t1